MTTSLLNSLLRALLRWGAALVFCLPCSIAPFGRAPAGCCCPLLFAGATAGASGTVHNTVAAAAPATSACISFLRCWAG